MTADNKKNCRVREKRQKVQDSLICFGCGRDKTSDECSWDEDDSGKIFCIACRIENESCGCSD